MELRRADLVAGAGEKSIDVRRFGGRRGGAGGAAGRDGRVVRPHMGVMLRGGMGFPIQIRYQVFALWIVGIIPDSRERERKSE